MINIEHYDRFVKTSERDQMITIASRGGYKNPEKMAYIDIYFMPSEEKFGEIINPKVGITLRTTEIITHDMVGEQLKASIRFVLPNDVWKVIEGLKLKNQRLIDALPQF